MEFEWDPVKAAANFRKHRLAFPFATRVFLDHLRLERVDESHKDDEERWVTIGMAGDSLITLVYTVREDRIRIISARRAVREEREEYGRHSISPGS